MKKKIIWTIIICLTCCCYSFYPIFAKSNNDQEAYIFNSDLIKNKNSSTHYFHSVNPEYSEKNCVLYS